MARSTSKTPSPSSAAEALALARERLEAFEESATESELLARLRAAHPLHPFLVGRAIAAVACVTTGIAGLVSLLIPSIDRELAVQMVMFESASGLPVPVALGILTLCAGAVLFTAHLAALSAARTAPWRPHEAKVYQRLTSDVRQLEAELSVSERLTPRTASPRIRTRSEERLTASSAR